MRLALRRKVKSRTTCIAVCAVLASSGLPATAAAASRAPVYQARSATKAEPRATSPAAALRRGGAIGMLPVAATPQPKRAGGNRVTLWDEIAPPSPLPLPIPVDAARAAEGIVATDQRE